MISTLMRAVVVAFAVTLPTAVMATSAAADADTLQILTDSKASFSGQFSANDVLVKFDTGLADPTQVVFNVVVDAKQLDVHFLLSSESVDVDGHGVTLTSAEKAALAKAADAILGYVEDSPVDYDMHTYLLVRMLQYWARMPEGSALGQNHILALR